MSDHPLRAEPTDQSFSQFSPQYGLNQPGVYPQTGLNQHYGAQGRQRSVDPQKQQMQEFINYRFTPEEQRVIRECEYESLVNRSLPYGFGLGLGTFFSVRNGYLKANAKYGPWPKVVSASILGYMIGRFSYMKVCQEKIMAIPNSRLAEMLRRRSRRHNPNADETYATDAGFATALTLAPLRTDDFNQPNSLNLDTDRPYDDFSDHFVPTREGTNDLNEDLNIPIRKNTVTYDELRQMNRDYFLKRQNPISNTPLGAQQGYGKVEPSPVDQTQSTHSSELGGKDRRLFAENDRRRASLRTKTEHENQNKYGDTWTE